MTQRHKTPKPTDHPKIKFDRRDYGIIVSAIIATCIMTVIVFFLLSTFKRMSAVYYLRNYQTQTKIEIMENVRILSEESSLKSLLKLREDPQGIPVLFIDMAMAREGEDGLKEIEREAAAEKGETRVWELAALENARPGFLESYFEASKDDVPRWLETIHAAALVDAYTSIDFGKEIDGHYICLFPGKKEFDEKLMQNFQNGLNRIYMEPDDYSKGRTKKDMVIEFLRVQLKEHPEIYKPSAREKWQKRFEDHLGRVFERRSVTQKYKTIVRDFISRHPDKLSPEGMELVNRFMSERYLENAIDFLSEEKVADKKHESHATYLRGHKGAVMCVAVSPADGTIASGGFDNTICLWNPDGSGNSKVIKGHHLGVLALAFSNDGKKLASAGLDGTVRVWNVADQKELVNTPAKTSRVNAVAFSRDDKMIVAGGPKGDLRLLNAESGTELGVLQTGWWVNCIPLYDLRFERLIISTKGEFILTESRQGKGPLLMNMDEKRFFKSNGGEVSSIAFSSDGKWLVAGSFDKAVRVWDCEKLSSENQPQVFKKHTSEVWEVKFTKDDKKTISAGGDQTIRIAKLGKLNGKAKVLPGHDGVVMTVDVSPDGKAYTSSSNDHTFRIWDAKTEEMRCIHRLDTLVNATAYTKDGKKIVFGCDDTNILLWPADFVGDSRSGWEKTVDWASILFSKDG